MSRNTSRMDITNKSSKNLSVRKKKKKLKKSRTTVTNITKGKKVNLEKGDTESQIEDNSIDDDVEVVPERKVYHWIGLVFICLIALTALILAILTTFVVTKTGDSGEMDDADRAQASGFKVTFSNVTESKTSTESEDLENISSRILILEDKGEDLERRLNDTILKLDRYRSSVNCTFDRHLEYSMQEQTVTEVIEETTETRISAATCSTKYYLSSFLRYTAVDSAIRAKEFKCECAGLLDLPAGERGVCGIDYWKCDRG